MERTETVIEAVCDACGVVIPHRAQLDIQPAAFRLRLDVHACAIGETPTATSIVVPLKLAIRTLESIIDMESNGQWTAGLGTVIGMIQTAIARATGVRG